MHGSHTTQFYPRYNINVPTHLTFALLLALFVCLFVCLFVFLIYTNILGYAIACRFVFCFDRTSEILITGKRRNALKSVSYANLSLYCIQEV